MADQVRSRHGYTPEFMDFPQHVRDAWEWIWAFYAWDHGQPKRLSDLIESGVAMPCELRPALAKLVRGDRKQKKKGQDKLSLPVDERMELAMHVSVALWMSKANETYAGSGDLRTVDYLADRNRLELSEQKRQMQLYRQKVIEEIARRFSVSPHTIKKILRDMRELAKKYPDV